MVGARAAAACVAAAPRAVQHSRDRQKTRASGGHGSATGNVGVTAVRTGAPRHRALDNARIQRQAELRGGRRSPSAVTRGVLVGTGAHSAHGAPTHTWVGRCTPQAELQRSQHTQHAVQRQIERSQAEALTQIAQEKLHYGDDFAEHKVKILLGPAPPRNQSIAYGVAATVCYTLPPFAILVYNYRDIRNEFRIEEAMQPEGAEHFLSAGRTGRDVLEHELVPGVRPVLWPSVGKPRDRKKALSDHGRVG
eukprot:gene33832-44847_t